MPKTAVCELETGVNWWLEDSDQCRWSSGSIKLYCHEIAQITWRRTLEELTCICGGNDLCLVRSCALSQCRDLIVWPGLEYLEAARYKNSTKKSILDVLKAT